MAGMLGRDRELAAVLRGVTDPEIALTLVVGEAGIGKSRLLTESVSADPSRLALVGGCLPMRRVLPLLPIIDALDTREPAGRRALTKAVRSLASSLRPHVAGVMPRTLPEEIEPAPEVRRDLLFLATDALLALVADETPVTLVVEDVHWADPDTLDLLTYLAGARHGGGVSLLVSCRADENPMPGHVAEWLDAQRRSTGVQELRLRPLAAVDVRRLVAALPHGEGADGERVSETVVARAEGNPFFVEQMVASAAAGDRVPRRLAELLLARLHAVSPSAQEVAIALAALARPVPVAALALVVSDDQGCWPAVRELDAAALLVRDEPGVRLRHALLAEAVLEELAGLPADYHRRLAVALESLEDPSASPEIAEHLRRAGDEVAELRAAQVAAQRSWEIGAYADAAQWYERLVILHARHPEEPVDLPEPEVVRRRVRALDLSGERRQATGLAELALRDFAEWPDLSERLTLLSYCVHLVSVEDHARGERLFEDLLPLYDRLPAHPDHAYVLDQLSSLHLVRGETQAALRLAEQALAAARLAGDLKRESQSLARMSVCHRRLGERRVADDYSAEAIAVAERCGDWEALLNPLVNASDTRLKYAEFEAAVATGQRGLQIAEQRGLQHSFQAQLLIANTAEAYLALGRTDEVGRLVDAVTDQPLRPDDDVLSYLRAHADLRRGDLESALERLTARGGSTVGNTEFIRMDAEVLAYVLLWNRRPAQAFDVVTEVLPGVSLGADGQDVGLLLTLGARAAADLPTQESALDSLARLDSLRETLTEDPFADRATLPRAAADGRQWHAERTRAEGRAEPGAWAEAAMAWESLSMSHDAAYCWWRSAEALVRRRADVSDIRTALHAAYQHSEGHVPLRREIVRLAAAARIPVLAASDVDDSPARAQGLTEQETRVLRLLAGGLTNAEIGSALFITPKTVSVHVSNLLRKLGVSNRTEAATWAVRHGVIADT